MKNVTVCDHDEVCQEVQPSVHIQRALARQALVPPSRQSDLR